MLRQGVLVRSDLFAEDGQRRVAVGAGQVTELLIVGAVLLDDVDDVLDLRRYADLTRNNGRAPTGGRASESRESL